MDINQASKIVGAYRYVFGSSEGETILKDIAMHCGMISDPEAEKQNRTLFFHAGDEMTESQRAYRDGAQDFYKYILTMATAEGDENV